MSLKSCDCSLGAMAALAAPAAAQEWPNRTITLIVPFAPGGGIDASARLQALVLGEILGQTIVVENVGAAAGTIGSGRVAKAAPDGYTFLVGNSGTHSYSQALYKKKPYDRPRTSRQSGWSRNRPASWSPARACR